MFLFMTRARPGKDRVEDRDRVSPGRTDRRSAGHVIVAGRLEEMEIEENSGAEITLRDETGRCFQKRHWKF